MSDTSLEQPDYQTSMKPILQDFVILEKPTRRKHPNQVLAIHNTGKLNF